MGVRSVHPLRLGILLDASIQQGWVVESVRQCMKVPGVSLAAVAIARGIARESVASSLHRLFDRLDRRIRPRAEPLFDSADVTAGLQAPLLQINADRCRDGWGPDAAGTCALQQCDVDIWLCFTATAPRRPMRPVSRLGVWGIEIGQDVAAASIWAGAMELGAGSPVTMASVVDYAASGDGLLYRSFGATVTNSARLNRLAALRKAVSFFRRLLERCTLNAENSLPAEVAAPAPAGYPALREPTLPAIVRLSWRLTANVVGGRLHKLCWWQQWQVAYYFADDSEPSGRFEGLRYLVPPRDRFWADPYAVEHQGRYFIFLEELPFDTQTGRIVVIEVFENGEPGEPQVALERPYHLSYPFLFDWDGVRYMMPETGANRTVEVYRCEAFPQRWSRHRTVLENINAYDATLYRDGDRWWMFVNVAEPGADSSDELHLYSSTTPLGPWTAHRANPVVSDVRRARPAGPLFSRDGMLYRPSQDCSLAYGHSVLINRVDVLDDDAYRETTVERVSPDWASNVLRIHTLGRSRRLRVIDCMVNRKHRLGGRSARYGRFTSRRITRA
ncbi:MAG TPA: hypothetical protein VMP00_13180 [Burkholderiales bacterium]|nr:hypothetical protein [Burkholderiales bacterium]